MKAKCLRIPKNVEKVEDSVAKLENESKEPVTSKRIAKSIYSLNFGYEPEEKIANQTAIIEQLEEGLTDILDVLTGWTRPLEDSEKLTFIEELAAKALSDSNPEHLKEGAD